MMESIVFPCGWFYVVKADILTYDDIFERGERQAVSKLPKTPLMGISGQNGWQSYCFECPVAAAFIWPPLVSPPQGNFIATRLCGR